MVEFTGRSVDCINFKRSGEDCQQKFDINGTSLYTVVRPTMCTLQAIISADAELCQEARLVCCGAKTGKTLALNIRLSYPDQSNTANLPASVYAYWPSTHPGGHTYNIYTQASGGM